MPPSPLSVAEPRSLYSVEPSHQSDQWVEALVDCPGAQGLYTYRIPGGCVVQPGDILSVPFGAQQVGAVAIRLTQQLPSDLEASGVRSIEDVVSQGFFPATYWSLLERVAAYYRTPLMQVVRIALPPGLLGRSQRRIRLKPEALPPDATIFLHPIAQRILALLQAQKQGDYAWHYLQRQVHGAQRGLQDLLRRGWVESYLEAAAPIRPKQRQAVTLLTTPAEDELSPRQKGVLDVLRRRGGEMWLQELLQTCQVSSSIVKTLAQKGYVLVHDREVLRLEAHPTYLSDRPKALTQAQTQAVETIQSLTHFAQVLLHGVTGSGKTEVYLQVIAPLLQQGHSVLVLVPEIGLTPQLTDRFRARFGERVRVYHSGLSDGERYDTWRQMLAGGAQVVIGTRSAVFAPLPNLGLIVLDEEHDSSFKQDQPAPCYHARTIAQWRAEMLNCPLVLGSATPSLESWVAAAAESNSAAIDSAAIDPATIDPATINPAAINPARPDSAATGSTATIHYLTLPQRIADRPMPPITIVDMRQELAQGNRSMFSRSLQTALRQLQEHGQQGMLFVPRRGHSTFVSCRSCGHVMECPHCDVSLSYHQVQLGGYQSLRCHYCNHTQAHPKLCPVCESPYLKHFGSGTQRVMQELAQQFPQLRCLRFDSDTTRAKGAHRSLLSRFAAGEADLLVGTQMLTKGIDLPQVTLVGVIAADGLLHLADYRASERAFQTLLQVAGRAGRGDEPGQVVIQTYSPQHPVIESVQRQDYAAFVTTELQFRSALHYPPYGHLVLLRLSGVDATLVRQTAQTIAADLRPYLKGWELLGPAPAAIERMARRYRWQILLKSTTATDLTDLPDLPALRSLCPTAVSLAIDVDPLHLG